MRCDGDEECEIGEDENAEAEDEELEVGELEEGELEDRKVKEKAEDGSIIGRGFRVVHRGLWRMRESLDQSLRREEAETEIAVLVRFICHKT